MFLRESACTTAKSRTNLSTNSGKATKRLGRLAPNLAHMCKFIWEWIYAKQIALRDTRGALGGVLGGQQFKSLGKMSDWPPTLVHVCGFIWEWTSRLNTSRPLIPQVAFRGGAAFSPLANSPPAISPAANSPPAKSPPPAAIRPPPPSYMPITFLLIIIIVVVLHGRP